MWSVIVEVSAPRCDEFTSQSEAVDQMFVQTFIPHPAVDAFHKAILHWFAGHDVVSIDFAVFLLFKDGMRGKLGSITPSE